MDNISDKKIENDNSEELVKRAIADDLKELVGDENYNAVEEYKNTDNLEKNNEKSDNKTDESSKTNTTVNTTINTINQNITTNNTVNNVSVLNSYNSVDSNDSKKTKKSFTLFDVSLACVIFLALQFVFVIGWAMVPQSVRQGPAYYVASFLLESLFGLTAWIVATKKSDFFKITCMKKKVNSKIFLYGFLIAVVSLLLFGRLTYVYSDFLYLLGYEPELPSITIDSFGLYIVYVLVSCLTPAFFEELLFRGVITSGLTKFKQTLALVLSALVFMLMHGSADQTIHQFIVGLILGYVFIKTKNLWLGVIIHFFNNFISVTLTYMSSFFTSDTAVEEIASSGNNPWIIWTLQFVIAIMSAVAGYIVVSYLIKKMLKEDENINGKDDFYVSESAVSLPCESTIIADTIVVKNIESNDEMVGEHVAFSVDGKIKNLSPENYETSKTEDNLGATLTNAGEDCNPAQDTKEISEDNNQNKALSSDNAVNEHSLAEIVEGEVNCENVTSENVTSENELCSCEVCEELEVQKNDESCDCEVCDVVLEEELTPKPLATMIMAFVSGFWLIFEWLSSLISGF